MRIAAFSIAAVAMALLVVYLPGMVSGQSSAREPEPLSPGSAITVPEGSTVTLPLSGLPGRTITVTGLPAAPPVRTHNDRLSEAGQLDPGFGGYFLDPAANSILYVYLLDPTQTESIRPALAAAFGPELVAGREIRVLQGTYSIGQLASWYKLLQSRVWGIPGVHSTDLAEHLNKLEVGVDSATAQAAVEELVANLGITRDAVKTTVRPAMRPMTHLSLQSYVRPIEAGLRIKNTAPSDPCTIGWNVVRNGVAGVITVTHCGTTMGGVDGNEYHQPTIGTGNRIGVETIDAPFFTGGACPQGNACRYSDSSFIQKDAGVSSNLGFIGKPETPGGTLILDHVSFRITGNGFPSVGVTIDKVGGTTGWSYGPVTQTCQEVAYTPIPGVLFLCQDIFQTGMQVGDSGATVFELTNSPAINDVKLYGVAWASDGTTSAFSYMGQVYSELGLNATWDECATGFGC